MGFFFSVEMENHFRTSCYTPHIAFPNQSNLKWISDWKIGFLLKLYTVFSWLQYISICGWTLFYYMYIVHCIWCQIKHLHVKASWTLWTRFRFSIFVERWMTAIKFVFWFNDFSSNYEPIQFVYYNLQYPMTYERMSYIRCVTWYCHNQTKNKS